LGRGRLALALVNYLALAGVVDALMAFLAGLVLQNAGEHAMEEQRPNTGERSWMNAQKDGAISITRATRTTSSLMGVRCAAGG
ncbi:MAG TPA: hypothetical protein VF151_10700, partial [Gemmatimonadales bacterium]